MRISLLILLLGTTVLNAQNNWSSKNAFEQKHFIENKGQVHTDKLPNGETVLYTANVDGVMYYFTQHGYTISGFVKQEMNEKKSGKVRQQENKKGTGKEEPKFKSTEKFYELNWKGTNPNARILAEEPVKTYYSYSDLTGSAKNKINTITAHAFTRITYKGLYPFTDVVFEFPKDSTGIKYSIYLYPGADIEKIKMSFPHTKSDIDENNDLSIHSVFGNITDHAPVSYAIESNTLLKSSFKKTKKEVGFTMENIPKNKTVVIDPWTVTPDFGPISSLAYDVDYDNDGNVYAYGSITSTATYSLLKFDPTGYLLWRYECVFDLNSIYGDFAIDRCSNSIYIVEGGNGFAGANALKINSSATLLARYYGTHFFTFMYRISFNKYTQQAVIGGGGEFFDSTYQICSLDTNLVLSPVCFMPDTAAFHAVACIALDNYGSCYALTTHAYYDSLYDNQLVKMPVPGFMPVTYAVNSGYALVEHSSVLYGYDYGFFSGGFGGLATSNNIVYSYDSYVLKKWDGPTGNLLVYKRIHYPAYDITTLMNDSSRIHWTGLFADDCGNIFVADSNVVLQYDSALTLVNSYPMPDIITDINMSNAGVLYVCGLGFVSSLTPTGIINCYGGDMRASTTSIDATCTTPGSATATITNGIPPYHITWNTLPVQYGPNATNLPPGTYTFEVADGSCTRNVLTDTVIVHASGGAFLSVPDVNPGCPGLNNGSIAITNSGGIDPYTFTWSPAAADTNALFNLAPGSYALTITDSAGCTNVYDSLLIIPTTIMYSFHHGPIHCFNDTTILTILPTNGEAPYLVNWTIPTAATGASLYGVHAGNFAGIITDNNGCTQPFTYTLNQPLLFTVDVTTSYNCAVHNTGSITINASGGDAPYTYSWADALSDTSYARRPLASGIYTITVTDSNSCVITIKDTIPVYTPVSITATTTGSCAGGANGSISATVTGGAAGSGYIYNWTGFPADSTNLLTNAAAGTYTLAVTSGLCADTTTFSIGTASILTILPANVCRGQTYTLPSGVIVTDSGTYTDTLRTSGGCDSVVNTVLTVGIPFISAGPDITIIPGASTLLTATGGTSYTWSPAAGLSCIACFNPVATPLQTTHYCVKIANGLCVDSACVLVTVEPPCADANELQIPDAFSPNNDGNNDNFLLQGWGNCMKDFNIIIYNRWGDKVFESDNPDFNWNGMYKGKALDPAVFVYYVKAQTMNNVNLERKGNITLIR